MTPDLWSSTAGADFAQELLLFSAFLFSGFVAILALASRSGLAAGVIAMGALSFGTPYFAVAIASLYAIHQAGPWVLAFLLTIVWLGDIVAFYVGTAWGTRKLAPRVSPNKTWVGAVGGFCAAVTVAAFWSIWRLGTLSGEILVLAALTAVAAQLGDLIESLIKRTVGVKDSGALLPGHGGMFDRLDALLLAAPVFALLLWVLDLQLAA
jgi:phosphatidate cytidylyltransferase